MIKYVIRDREGGNVIDEFRTREEAVRKLREFEDEDRLDGVFVRNFYEIAEIEE